MKKKYLSILFTVTLITILGCSQEIYAQIDSNYKKFTFYKIGLDITKPLLSAINKKVKTIELHAETNIKPNINLAVNAGIGSSTTKNIFLDYTNTNFFLTGGFDKLLFKPDFINDNSNVYIGVQYGISYLHRSQAAYTIYDSLYGNRNGILTPSNMLVHWGGIHVGFSLEVKKNIFMGWQIDGKALISSKKLETLQPSYIAGYGFGDKNPTYNYHFYLLYGIEKRKK